jgi:hypothetical protein
MTAPLISSLAAYMAVTQRIIPWQHTMVWIILLVILGVLFAFPLKKRFINDEQLPFPEGYAAGIVPASDMIKIAMVRMHAALAERGLAARMLLQVHDELLFEAPPEEVETVERLAREIMESALPLDVPVVVDVKSGRDWSEV